MMQRGRYRWPQIDQGGSAVQPQCFAVSHKVNRQIKEDTFTFISISSEAFSHISYADISMLTHRGSMYKFAICPSLAKDHNIMTEFINVCGKINVITQQVKLILKTYLI